MSLSNLGAKMKSAVHAPHNIPNNGSWWLMIALSSLCSIFMITALARDDAEKKWRYLSLAGCMIMLLMLIGSIFVPAIGKITMPQCGAVDEEEVATDASKPKTLAS